MFRTLEDPRVGVYSAFEDGVPEADILVLPCGTAQAMRQSRLFASLLPVAVRRRISTGRALVVLDASTEGELHRPDRTDELHALLDQVGARPERAVYVTQDRHYEADYARYRPSGRMWVDHYDVWIWRFFEPFQETGEAVFAERLALFETRGDRRKRRFVSLNFTPRPLKVAFLLSVLRDELWDRGSISFGGFERYCREIGVRVDDIPRLIADHPQFEDLGPALAPWLPALDAVGETLLDRKRSSAKRPISDKTLSEYAQSWFSVVTETEMYDRPSRITEKPFKALVNFHPILVFGNPGALAMVRGLGFETFPELFDEGYDDELSPRARFDWAYAQFVRLCRMDETALARLMNGVREKLIHNARWGLTRFPRDYKARYDAALVDRFESLL